MSWFSKIFSGGAGAIAGVLLAPFTAGTSLAMTAGTAALIGAGVGMTIEGSVEQSQLAADAKSVQKKATAAALSSQRDLAGESAALTTEQMKLQVGQRKIATLEEVLLNTPTSPRILTLPSNQPAQTWVDRANASIDSFIKG